MDVLQKWNRSIPDGNETAAAVLFFLLFIFLKQFYLFPSGGMEAADVCLFASFFMLLCDCMRRRPERLLQLKTESLFYVFLASVLMINAYYGIRLGRGEFFKYTCFWIFNASFPEKGKTPVGNATSEELAAYNAWFAASPEENIIYLTFDCGYENGNTPAILDALQKHQAPAAFFVVGNFLSDQPDLVKRMAAEGHIVGNHTWSHPDMSKISTQEAFSEELNRVSTLYQETTGQEMVKFYRPPQGKYSTQNLQMAKDLGYHTFFWSLAYVDWYQDNQPDPQEAIAKLTKRIHPGAIVLLHSTSSTNAQILDELLDKWEAMGYSFHSLNEL